MSNLIFISCREKEKGLGPISYLRAIFQLSKMVAVKERIALIRAISRGNERRRMFSESAQMLIALRRRRIALLLSLAEFSHGDGSCTIVPPSAQKQRLVGDGLDNIYR